VTGYGSQRRTGDGAGDLERFRALVVADLGRPGRPLAGPLLAARTRAELVALVPELASGCGLVVSTGEVEEALRTARRSWLERWV
jgi:hypothetical protein